VTEIPTPSHVKHCSVFNNLVGTMYLLCTCPVPHVPTYNVLITVNTRSATFLVWFSREHLQMLFSTHIYAAHLSYKLLSSLSWLLSSLSSFLTNMVQMIF